MAERKAKNQTPEVAGPEFALVSEDRVFKLSNNSDRPIDFTVSFSKDSGRKTEKHRVEAKTEQFVWFEEGATVKAHFAD